VWNGTQFTAIQDRSADPICSYNQANVINGKFTRQYAAQKAIYTAVEVEYADQRNMYQKAIEYVSDDAMIARYGYNVKKMTAYACTSRGQAHRYGKWVLETSRLEQCTITFSVGRQGLMHLPGDIIEVADNSYAGRVLGGRVVAINGKTITLDAEIEISSESYFSYLNAEMQMMKIKIASINKQNNAIITLESEPVSLAVMDEWVIKSAVVSSQLFRAIGITENEDGSYTITALQHEPQKELIVDGSASFEPVNTTIYTGALQPIQDTQVSADEKGITLSFTSSTFVGQGLKYQVKLYRDNKLYAIYDDLLEPNLAFTDLPDSDYVAEIRAKNSAGQLSEPKTTTFTVNFTVTELVTVPKIFAIELNWKNPLYANSKSAIELWVSSDNNFDHARKLVTLAYPTNNYTYSGLGIGDRFWFWARMVNGSTAGKFTESVVGVPSDDTTQLTDYLAGKITKTELGQSLIDSLQADIDSAVDDEAKIRQAAVANTLAQITEQAQISGTAINELKKVDAQQAQQIATITAKAENALSGITTEQQARADGDKANADKITVITARVGSAESSIANIQSTKASKTEVSSIAQQSLQSVWKADAQNAVDSLNIGGRNFLRNSSLSQNLDKWQNWGTCERTFETINGRSFLRLKVDDTQKYRGISQNNVALMPDTDYVISITAFSKNTTDKLVFGFHQNPNVNPQIWNTNIALTSTPTRYSFRFKSTSDQTKTYFNVMVGGTLEKSFDIYISEVKLEIGNIPTGWIPAPEDAESNITTLSAKINSVQTTLSNADTALGQRIDTVTATANTNKASIATEQTARASADTALGQRIDTVTATANSNKAQISTVSNAVATVDNKLSATHTIKTQVLSGGRTAIAGIALGATADNKTTESSVIVMADKFGVVKNATDSSVVSMLSVVNNKVAINGDLIADGTILGNHIKASQTINSPVINGGSLNIGNGRFSVNSAGAVTIRNSTSNVGMVINNNNIIVYDSNGKIRVRLGMW